MTKEDIYQRVLAQLEDTYVFNRRLHRETLWADALHLLKSSFPYMDWIGYYHYDSKLNVLYLGQFLGDMACEEIAVNKGVCGRCFTQKATQLVEDVHKLSYHIACSSSTNSEIVVPIFEKGNVISMLDIDSDDYASFDSIDQKYLEKICQLLQACH